MRYCQFENALETLQDVREQLEEEQLEGGVGKLSEREWRAKQRLFRLMRELIDDYDQ